MIPPPSQEQHHTIEEKGESLHSMSIKEPKKKPNVTSLPSSNTSQRTPCMRNPSAFEGKKSCDPCLANKPHCTAQTSNKSAVKRPKSVCRQTVKLTKKRSGKCGSQRSVQNSPSLSPYALQYVEKQRCCPQRSAGERGHYCCADDLTRSASQMMIPLDV